MTFQREVEPAKTYTYRQGGSSRCQITDSAPKGG